jgi:hypothetical protein
MSRAISASRRIMPCMLALLFVSAGGGGPVLVHAQLPVAEDKLKILTDPESVKQKLESDKKQRPPLEFFRSQVAPFDILPFVKPNHWSTLTLELRANLDDYSGMLQSEPVLLLGMPHAILYRREARLPKGQRMRLGMQVMMPEIPREMAIDLLRPEGVRADDSWRASLRMLDPHQMLVLVLTRGSNDSYASWNRQQAFTPLTLDMTEVAFTDRQRYYRLVLPLEPDRPPLSSQPLTWTTISHVIWDGMPPETLSVGQQQALIDWLHWGGQLILMGGATPSFTLLRDSFLDPYLPADPSGESVLLGENDLKGLSAAYLPPLRFTDPVEAAPIPLTEAETQAETESQDRYGLRYRAPEPIRPASNRPLYVAGLRPREGSSVIPLDESSGRLLGVERRVGRGRVLMLSVNPTDAALATWPGLDTLVRRVVLRRPEEKLERRYGISAFQGVHAPVFGRLSGPQLTWFRLLSRDFGTPRTRLDSLASRTTAQAGAAVGDTSVPSLSQSPSQSQSPGGGTRLRGRLRNYSREPVAEWDDELALPKLCRNELERASGITIPSSTFVLKVVLGYIIALVPLNWLICRYLLRRREWAWILVPALALGFAIGVERAAAYDMGYDTACDEIDVVEAFGGYPRAHVSRFASLYSTGRTRFTIAFPGDSTGLALPLNIGRSLRGEDVATSIWQSYPVPALEGFQVQPRSLAMFRAEQLANLAGAITLERDAGGAGERIVNASDLELRDAVVIDVDGPRARRETYVGTIPPGSTVAVAARRRPEPRVRDAKKEGPDPKLFLSEFSAFREDRPENQGEIRLVAWTPGPHGGLKLDPVVDRHRGFSLVVVHLKSGPPPAPDGPAYNDLARATGG